jgi:hyperosmotically inducible protein
MKARAIVVAAVFVGSCSVPLLSKAEAPDAGESHSTEYVTDSAIAAAVKTRLAQDHVGSLSKLKINANQDGVVWLSGSTQTQEAADRAVEAARNVDGVMAVKSTIVVAPETK